MENFDSAARQVNPRALPLLTSHAADFLDRLPEERPDLCPGIAKDVDRVFSLDAVEQIIVDQGIRPPLIRMVRSGNPVALTSYTNAEKVPDPTLIHRELEGGSTLILNNVSRHWRPVTDFCRRLGYELGRHVGANAYLTPARAQGHTHHYDTHSSFIVQVYGRKTWRLYRPFLNLPVADSLQELRKRQPLSEHDRERIYHGEPDMLFELSAGDVLWLPRGWVHDVFASDSPSLHLTLGIWEVSSRQLLTALAEILTDEEDFRRAMPVRLSSSAQTADASAEDFLARMTDWVATVDPEHLSRKVVDELRAIRYPPRSQPISQLFLTDEDLASCDGLIAIREAAIGFARLPTGELEIDTGAEKLSLDAAVADLFESALAADDAQPISLERYRDVLGDRTLSVIRKLLGSGIAVLARNGQARPSALAAPPAGAPDRR